MKTIVLMGNNSKILEFFSRLLQREGYMTLQTGFDSEVLELLETIKADMLIVDAAIKGVDSARLIEDALIQQQSDLPTLILADKDVITRCQGNPTLADKLPGFISKPICPEELVPRVHQLFQDRLEGRQPSVMGSISLDTNSGVVRTAGATIPLSRKEFAILQKLLSKPHHIFTREEILETAWGSESDTDIRTVDVHIKRLRNKLAEIGELRIGTVRGVGYKAWVAG